MRNSNIEPFDIDKIVDYLKPYSKSLDKLYLWDTPSDEEILDANERGIFNIKQCNELISEENVFERNVKLKMIISKILSETNISEFKKQVFKWIVQDWGGISVKNVNKLHTLVSSFLDQNQKSRKLAFDSIASVTKILSFISPEKYVIYDARVAYSINWILLKTTASKIFFPMPESRNSKIKAIDISTLIRLSNIDKYSNNLGANKMISNSDKRVFVEKSIAYITLCDLIMEVNKKLWEDERKEYLFYTEMLIFSLADTNIFTDVLKSCNLNIG